MAITAQMVKELRERTSAPMMDCKTALTETQGDMEKAVDFLRRRIGKQRCTVLLSFGHAARQ